MALLARMVNWPLATFVGTAIFMASGSIMFAVAATVAAALFDVALTVSLFVYWLGLPMTYELTGKAWGPR